MSDTPRTDACFNEDGYWTVLQIVRTSRTLEREVATLTAEVGRLTGICERQEKCIAEGLTKDEAERLRARLTELKQDKARLDWLEQNMMSLTTYSEPEANGDWHHIQFRHRMDMLTIICQRTGPTIRQAIDAARNFSPKS